MELGAQVIGKYSIRNVCKMCMWTARHGVRVYRCQEISDKNLLFVFFEGKNVFSRHYLQYPILICGTAFLHFRPCRRRRRKQIKNLIWCEQCFFSFYFCSMYCGASFQVPSIIMELKLLLQSHWLLSLFGKSFPAFSVVPCLCLHLVHGIR